MAEPRAVIESRFDQMFPDAYNDVAENRVERDFFNGSGQVISRAQSHTSLNLRR